MYIKIKISSVSELQFNTFLRFLCYLGKYESKPFLDPQVAKIFSMYPDLTKKTDLIPEIAAQCYLQLANHEGYFNIKAAFFFILANNLKEAKHTLKELSKFTQTTEIEQLRNQAEFLASYKLGKLYSSEIKLDMFSSDIQAIFNETLEHVKKQVLEVRRIHKQRYSTADEVNIKIKIKNLADIPFMNLKIIDPPPKKAQVDILESNSFYFPQIGPNKELTCEYHLGPKAPQKISFKNGSITFEDSYGTHYVQTIPTTRLQIQ